MKPFERVVERAHVGRILGESSAVVFPSGPVVAVLERLSRGHQFDPTPFESDTSTSQSRTEAVSLIRR